MEESLSQLRYVKNYKLNLMTVWRYAPRMDKSTSPKSKTDVSSAVNLQNVCTKVNSYVNNVSLII